VATIWRARRNLRRLLLQQRFDCVITHSPWGQAIFGPAIRKTGVPNVFWMHDFPDGKHWIQRWARRHPPDFVLCNSRFTQSELKNLYRDVPSDVMYSPVQDAGEHFSPAAREAARRALDLPLEAIVLIQTGRMEPVKGHRFMLESLALLRDVPNWICLVVGGRQREQDVPYMQNLAALAADRGIAERVRFLGERSDVPQLLATCDIYAQGNSGPETFGIVFIEALYAGLPVVTTNLGGAREIVADDCGFLVPLGDTSAFAAVLKRLIEDPHLRHRLGSTGPARAEALCSPIRQTRLLYELASSVSMK
jgi:glycosyltransferase involved in cell wall biosynthesis